MNMCMIPTMIEIIFYNRYMCVVLFNFGFTYEDKLVEKLDADTGNV